MVRSSFVLAGVLCTTATIAAAFPAETLFDHRVHDFGTVSSGPILTHAFRLTNTTDEPIRIASVRGSCSCLNAFVGRNELAPGESTTVIARINTSRISGLSVKAIYVAFDQPERAEVRLIVQVNVRR